MSRVIGSSCKAENGTDYYAMGDNFPYQFDGTMYLGPLVRLFADVQPGRTILVDGQTGKVVDERVPAPDALQRELEALLGGSP